MDSRGETYRLRQEIERTLKRAFDPADVLPRLARLARLTSGVTGESARNERGADARQEHAEHAAFAERKLAELLAAQHPWRAAVHARRALALDDGDDRVWATLALCQTLLGHFHYAETAYKRAIAIAPGNPWYAHNLGHLLDVALAQPERAIAYLARAHEAKRDNAEIVASYVHALGRTGRIEQARGLLQTALARFESRELEALLRWLDQGAPAGAPARAAAKARCRRAGDTTATGSLTPGARRPRTDRRLSSVLSRGLSCLPLDARQRQRAMALAADVLADKATITPLLTSSAEAPSPRKRAEAFDAPGWAAAIAYAIVYVDHVPLSQAEVAAPFRVAVGRLRGRFSELRAKLDLIRGDARYATTRR